MKSLDKFAYRKKTYSGGNNIPFMNKLLSRAHMKRTRLRNCYLKKRSEQNRLSYVKQRNYCVSLLRKTKKDYYANLNVKDIVDNKQFWRTVKPLFSDKTKSNEKITLVEDETVTTQDEQNAELLNIFFSDAVKNLKIPIIICKKHWKNCASSEKAVTTSKTLTEYTMRSCTTIADFKT